MADYRLTQTGDQVQDILNNSTPQSELTAETQRAELAEQTLQGNINTEAQARQQADGVLQGNIDTEETRAKAAEKANADDIDGIEAKIPIAATAQNKLVDEQKMNSSIATATATYRGSFNLVTDLHLTVSATESDIANTLASTISTADNNDYCYIQIPVANDKPTEIARIDRYKYNGTAWSLEYTLNNSGFTSDQWNALNSGITNGLVGKLNLLPTKAELDALFANIYTKSETNSAIGAEETRARAAEQQNAGDIDIIESKIPSAASSSNQLADKAFVNSTVATSTATYRGSYNLVSDLSLNIDATAQQIATALSGAIVNADNNDYCFVQIPTSNATPTVIARVDRYKFDGTAWSFEYSLNNSGFTAAQWEALNSGITSGLVAKLTALPTNAELELALLGKQAVISDLATIRSGAALGATAYQKPSSGIPSTDLTTELQLALASFITNTTQNLAYYYLKSETYSASQVDQMLAAIRQFQYEAVQTLPTPSAQTVGKIYLVPSADPQTQNTKDEYITLTTVEEGTTTYAWEQIGSTDIDLTNYYTKAQADAAITAALNTALAAYSTTSQVSTMISTAINSALQAYATKEYVSAQVQEYAGTFRGTYNSLADLQATTGNHHNDYAWVQVTDSDGDNDYDRYKYNGSAWVFEYRLNNTHFTSAQLASISSGITSEKVVKLDALPPTASSTISATTGAAAISNSKQFFVGTQGNDGKWTLESLTPAEMQKCAYAYLASATVGNTPAHIQGTDASGNPQRITPVDLASVLGGVYFYNTNATAQSLDDLTVSNLYRVADGLLIVAKSQNRFVIQNHITYEGMSKIRYGLIESGSTTWYNWTPVGTFGNNTLSELATALGAPTQIDANNVAGNGTFTFEAKSYTLFSIYDTQTGNYALLLRCGDIVFKLYESPNFGTQVTVTASGTSVIITNNRSASSSYRIVIYRT